MKRIRLDTKNLTLCFDLKGIMGDASDNIPANTIKSYTTTAVNIMNPNYYEFTNSGCNSICNPFYITQESNYLVIQMSSTNISDENIQCDVRVIL